MGKTVGEMDKIMRISGERGLEEGPCCGLYRVEFSSSLPVHRALILAKSSCPSVETQWDGGLCEEILCLA